MNIAVLLENTAGKQGIISKHGLSLYISTPKHRILFDAGPDDSFLKNAAFMNINLANVELAILSHGHRDHGGGMEFFCDVNATAQIYLRQTALLEHKSLASGTVRDIGLPQSLLRFSDRFVFTAMEHHPDPSIILFSVPAPERTLLSNQKLCCRCGDHLVQDDFCHEQNLLLCEEGIAVLFAGCAHCGILHILQRSEELLGRSPDFVFGGFHMCTPSTGETEPENRIREIGAELACRNTIYYTGHCTGESAFSVLKETLGDRLHAIHSGAVYAI